MQGWIRQCEKNVKRQKNLKYNCVYCVKNLSELNNKWVHAWEKKLRKRKILF